MRFFFFLLYGCHDLVVFTCDIFVPSFFSSDTFLPDICVVQLHVFFWIFVDVYGRIDDEIARGRCGDRSRHAGDLVFGFSRRTVKQADTLKDAS